MLQFSSSTQVGMASLIAIEENAPTETVNEIDEKDEEIPETERQPTVFKRAHTVMLTEQMQWFEDDYVKLEPLGEPGTFGMAFKCYKKSNNSMYYAVKQINKAKFYFKETKGVLDNMKNEILIMNMLSTHPNICKLHETYEDRNYIYLILDFLSGGELYAKIEELGELEEVEAQRITKQILSAIKYMQDHMIAHLDLKPDNILFDNNNNVKLIDFGEAIIKNKQKINIKCGTPFYMAPEIIREIPYDPFPADMWSIGVIIFCMLFGFVPFHAEEENEIFEKIKKGFKNKVLEGYGAFFPKDIPISNDAMDIISGMLTSNPNKRFNIYKCLNHSWILTNLTINCIKPKKQHNSNNKQQSIRKLFLVNEDPIIFSDDDDDDNDNDNETETETETETENNNNYYIKIEAPLNGIIKK
eukprot:48988_1